MKLELTQEKLKSRTYSFHIPITPVAKGRPRMGKGFVYTPKKTFDFEQAVKRFVAAKFVGNDFLEGPLEVALVFVFKRPKSRRKSEKYHIVRPDADNLVKGVLDALNGILWQDDSTVCSMGVVKLYSDEASYIDLIVSEIP